MTGKRPLLIAILALATSSARAICPYDANCVNNPFTGRNPVAPQGGAHLLILDDVAYLAKDQAETSVLFELIGARYERRSMLITANQPFGEWGEIFPDTAMTLAAIDRLVHHAAILEMNVDSYRRKEAIDKARRRSSAGLGQGAGDDAAERSLARRVLA